MRNLLTVPGSIILGAILISASILVSGGVIKIKGINLAQTTSTTTIAPSATPEEKLTNIAANLKLDTNKFSTCLKDKKYQQEISSDQSDAESSGIQGTPGFVIGKESNGVVNGIKVGGAYPYNTFKIIFDEIAAGTTLDQVPDKIVNSLYPDASESERKDLIEGFEITTAKVDDDPLLGDKSSNITMVEFSDYECPFCKRHFTQTLPQIKKDYIDKGLVKLVYRDYVAVPSHNPAAELEALAANCARDLGGDEAYFKYHDSIFQNTKSNGAGV